MACVWIAATDARSHEKNSSEMASIYSAYDHERQLHLLQSLPRQIRENATNNKEIW